MTSSANRPALGTAGLLSLPVIVASLGYFVDIYDLVLVGMVRNPSLAGIGIDISDVTKAATIGGNLLGTQMIGMLIGGFLWGMVADKYGRLATLFGSIITYSLATALNGAVTDLWQYYLLRFIAGIGLAGELGTGITLVCESLPKEKRAYGATIVACVGIAGAIAAYYCSNPAWFDWRTAYYIGGGMGFALLILRWLSHESGLFAKLDAEIPKGSLGMLLGQRDRLGRYLRSVALGMPTWFVVGFFVFGGDKMAAAIGVDGKVSPRDCILWCYIGLIAGDFLAGVLSQWLASRRKAIFLFLLASMVMCGVVVLSHGVSAATYLTFSCLLGVTVGFWALFVTVAAEQFGTNLRATVATTVPNIARGLLYPMQWLVVSLSAFYGHLTTVLALGAVCFVLALLALWKLEETHGKDLDYLEELA